MAKSYVLKPNTLVSADQVANTSNGSIYFPVQSGGNGLVLVIHPVMDGGITVCPGDGLFAGKELYVDVYADEVSFIHLETGPYLITEGTHRGCICVDGDCDADLYLIELN